MYIPLNYNFNMRYLIFIMLSSTTLINPINPILYGKVVDKISGEALVGVEITTYVDATKTYYTDLDGNFILPSHNLDDTIFISYISYSSTFVLIESKSSTYSKVVVELESK